MKAGTRVRKARGKEHIGATGLVVSGFVTRLTCDILIKLDHGHVNSSGVVFFPGEVCECFAYQWEPIVPEGHQPAEETVEELLPFLKGVSA